MNDHRNDTTEGAAPAMAGVDLDGRLGLHPDVKVTATRVGREGAPVIVIDNFLQHPEVLVDYAARCSTFDSETDTTYPGMRAPLPPVYCLAVRDALGELVARTMGLQGQSVTRALGYLSLVTTPPPQLGPLQRLPHVDSLSPGQVAVLHYLCTPDKGGTSFYRHRRTGFESVDASRAPAYQRAMTEDHARLGPPPASYLRGDDQRFERTAGFEAAFNRVLVYQSYRLHSGSIPEAFDFDANPRTGRLTANTFLYYG